ncbi:alpha/beta hydrolase [Burkholderia ubonensis]|uniref:alpha/beta hydrolase n=1 Tax=Burkholderia ubonensis TaxID=101571 RepID=UPI00075E341A|nr:alpha/beta hydrolase [Burkholderia ubonensis]KVP42017.1 alpha/beta hydrolase [Burkholderia ubonensis]
MKPIVFDGCVGWLHEGHTKRGVVLCESLGHEAIWTHKLIRAIAERLASDGITVLRFNYPCAGDSRGDDLDAGRFGACVASIRSAIDTLHAYADIAELTLVGIRAGALFAMLAATATDEHARPRVDALVAVAPVVQGRMYLRELSLIHRQWLDTAPPSVRAAQHDEPCANVLGHRYPVDLVSELAATDLCCIVEDAAELPRAMLLIETDSDHNAPLCAALRSRGVDVATEAFPEWPTAMQEGMRSRLPVAMIGSLARWVAAHWQQRVTGGLPRTDVCVAWRGEAVAAVAMEGLTESVVAVGPDRLIGILCCSTGKSPPKSGNPALLIVNTAANPRSADGRVGVRMARAIARSGVTTLRIDINGVGDSGLQAPDDQAGIPYSSRAIDDIAAAATWLDEQGYQDIVAIGICSGAYEALHAAARSRVLAGVIAINLSRFIWPDHLTLDAVLKARSNSARGYWVSGRDWRRWKRLVTERRDLRPILRSLAGNLVARVRVPAMDVAARFGWTPRDNTPRGMMHELARRGVWTLLVYGELDPGIDDVHRHFGSPARAFRRSRHVRIRTLPQLDHALYGTSGANAVIDFCIGTLAGEAGWPPARAASRSPAGATRSSVADEDVRDEQASVHTTVRTGATT